MVDAKKCCSINKTLLKFYTSCTLSSWGDRIWFFALSVYFIEINRSTLLINAINGFLRCASVILFGSVIGGLVDKHDRISVVKVSLVLQNTTVAVTCVLVVLIIVFRDAILPMWSGSLIYILQGIMIFLNIISGLASVATTIAIEKDWVIVIAENVKKSSKEKTHKLAAINAQVRRLDLTTSVLAPIFAGLVMSFANLSKQVNGIVISAILLAAWNLVSLFIELTLLQKVYNEVPSLKKEVPEDENEKSKFIDSLKRMSSLYKGWFVYFKQGILCLPGLSLATLFLTVLSFDSITIGYAKSQDLSETAISVLQGLGALFGILGTFAFSLLHNKFKLKLTAVGLTGSIFQLLFLTLCLVSVWLPGSPFELSLGTANSSCVLEANSTTIVNSTLEGNATSSVEPRKSFMQHLFLSPCRSYTPILMLLLCMALSRFGLWLFDLAVHQIIQENVAEAERGVVGGVQRSLNQLFELIKYGIVIALPTIPKYGYLAIISYSAVFTGFILFVIYTSFLLFCGEYHQVPQMEPVADTKPEASAPTETEMQVLST